MVSTNTKCQIAFKEWAVAVDALMSGEQVMLIRKAESVKTPSTSL